MTIEQAKQRLRALMPAGSRVNVSLAVNYDDATAYAPARRSTRWRFTVHMPGMPYLKDLWTPGGTLAEATESAAQHLARYVKYRAARARRLARPAVPEPAVKPAVKPAANPFPYRGSTHVLELADGYTLTLAPYLFNRVDGGPWVESDVNFCAAERSASICLGAQNTEAIRNAFMAGLFIGREEGRKRRRTRRGEAA